MSSTVNFDRSWFQIDWEAKLALSSDEQQDMVMPDPEQKSGSVVCKQGHLECSMEIKIRKDAVGLFGMLYSVFSKKSNFSANFIFWIFL